MKKVLKILPRIILVVLIIGAIILYIASRNNINSLPVYDTEKVLKGNITLTVSASGAVISAKKENVTINSTNKVTQVMVQVGDPVKAGALLAKLDDSTAQNNLLKAKYNYYAAIYNKKQAQAAPVQDSNKINQLQQLINSAYVDVQNAQKAATTDLQIVAPVSGQVTDINVYEGSTPSQTQPAFVIQSTDNIKARLEVNQNDISKISVGQTVNLKFNSAQLIKTGKITKIYPSAISNNNGVVAYYVEASIDDTKNLLVDMTIDSDILIQSKTGVLTIPSAAIVQQDDKTYVNLITYMPKNSSEKIQTKLVEVKIGINNNTTAEVLSGVNENDELLITSGSSSSSSSQPGFFNRPATQIPAQ